MPTLPPAAQELPNHLVSNARVLATRTHILPLLPKRLVVAEVGVGTGLFTRQILQLCDPRVFFAIDLFDLHTEKLLWGQPPTAQFGSLTHHDWYAEHFASEVARGVLQLHRGNSSEILQTFADHSLDMIYIDGDHSYEGVCRDLAPAVRKIRPDGTLILNDYVMVDVLGSKTPYGVVYATNEFMIRENWAMQYFALQTNMYCDVVLRKPDRIESHENDLNRLTAENADLRHRLRQHEAS